MPTWQQKIHIIAAADGDDSEQVFCVIHVVGQPELRSGDFDFVKVGQAVQRIFGNAGLLQPIFEQLLLKAAFDAFIQPRPLLLCIGVDGKIKGHQR